VEGAAGGLWAVHERSFVLHLPDEEPDTHGMAWRSAATTELRALRRGLNRYRTLSRLKNEAISEERQQ
jgi:hypothetical protein